MIEIPYTISTRTPKEQDSLVNRVLDFEMELMTSATGAALGVIKSRIKNGANLKEIKAVDFKTPLSSRFNISTTAAYCAATSALGMYRSRDTNTRDQYLPKAQSDLLKAEKRFKSLKRSLSKEELKLVIENNKLTINNANAGRILSNVRQLRMKLSGSNRKIQCIKTRIKHLTHEIDTCQYSICLGSKKLFKSQHNLYKNGFKSHSDWKRSYHYSRWSGVTYIGDQGEVGGGRLAKLFRVDDGYNLVVVLSPAARKKFEAERKSPETKAYFTGNSLIISKISFARKKDSDHAEELINIHAEREKKKKQFKTLEKQDPGRFVKAKLQRERLTLLVKKQKDQRKGLGKNTELNANLTKVIQEAELLRDSIIVTQANYCGGVGQAITVRFLRCKNGWRYDISFSLKRETNERDYTDHCVIGIDTNYDHFAIAAIGEEGILKYSASLDFRDPNNKINNDAIWASAAVIVDEAKSIGASIAVESLCFKGKKTELYSGKCKGYNRMLSTFAFTKMLSAIKRRAIEAGVKVVEVNPAYTSFTGRLLFSDITESIHESAAYVIALKAQEQAVRANGGVFESKISFDTFSTKIWRRKQPIGCFDNSVLQLPHVDGESNGSITKPLVNELFGEFIRYEKKMIRTNKLDIKSWRNSLKYSMRKNAKVDKSYDDDVLM